MSTNTSEITKCAICFASTKLRCSQCKVWFFCSNRCSKFFWPIHKLFCPYEVSPDIFTLPPLSAQELEIRRSQPEGLNIHKYRKEGVFHGRTEAELVELLTSPPSRDRLDENRFGAMVIARSEVRLATFPINTPVETVSMRLALLLYHMAESTNLPLGQLAGGGKGPINVFARRYLVVHYLASEFSSALLSSALKRISPNIQFILDCANSAVPALSEAVLDLPPLLLAKAKFLCEMETASLDLYGGRMGMKK